MTVTEETRQRMSAAAKRRWASKAAREKLSASVRAEWQDDSYRAKQEASRAPGTFYHESHVQAMRERWASPDTRPTIRITEKRRRAASERQRALWALPEYRERAAAVLLQNVQAQWQNQEFRQARSEAVSAEMLEQWSDETFREERTRAITHPPVKGVCAYCGGAATETDHDLPRSRGGTDDPANLVLACRPCNASKHCMTGDEFRKKQAAEEMAKGNVV